MKPTYFDLTVNNFKDARQFFEHVVGWRFEKVPFMPYEYYHIIGGEQKETGIDGGIGETKDAPIANGKPMTLLSIPVVNLEKTLMKVKEKGGIVLEQKTILPGVGWFATAAEPGGLKFALLQVDLNAK